MSVDPGPESAPAETKKPKKAKPDQPPVRVGDTVIYTPSGTQQNVYRSLRGVKDPTFCAIVTYLREDGAVDLWVLPSHKFVPHAREDVREGEGPNTFCRRD